MVSPISVGIIGFGFSAKTFHWPFLEATAPYVVRKIYTNQVFPSANNLAIGFTSRIGDIWEDPEIDLVVVTSPNALHFEHAFKALSFDKLSLYAGFGGS